MDTQGITPRQRIRPRQLQPPRIVTKLVPKPKVRKVIPALLIKRKKRIRKKRKPARAQAYEVWARPLKRVKKGKRPKLIKVSKVPLSKTRAKSLRNYIVDHSLGRTARIKPSIGKPSTPKLKVPKGYARKTSKKFRKHRIQRGKKIPLVKGRVIEGKRYLLDTKSEIRKIGVLRRIKMLEKTSGFKPTKRKRSPVKSKPRRRTPRRDRGIFG